MQLILNYFPKLTKNQIQQFNYLDSIYKYWNSRINVISRKDIDSLYIKHVLHSLSIAKVIDFNSNTKVLDVGTGGGFPGIPLAILFPEVEFMLLDSINKKINVVNDIVNKLHLKNVLTSVNRVEDINESYDFVVSRAVTNMPNFIKYVNDRISSNHNNNLRNGILYLKGGDLSEELKDIQHKIYDINSYFKEDFFATKKIVYISY